MIDEDQTFDPFENVMPLAVLVNVQQCCPMSLLSDTTMKFLEFNPC